MEAIADKNRARKLHVKAWAEEYELIDRQLSPLGLRAMKELSLNIADTVLDVGCGTGQTILQLAKRVGEEGLIYGVDIADELLVVAGERTSHLKCVKLVNADAQSFDASPNSIDAVFSRFGVMGFFDPVLAFTNFNRLLKPGGRIAFCCWRPFQDNELDRFPLLAAGIALPVDSTPFSFSDPDHVHHVLTAAGYCQIAITPYDEAVTSGDVDVMTEILLKTGPLGKIARENSNLRFEAEHKLRQALAGISKTADVSLVASVWIVTARK